MNAARDLLERIEAECNNTRPCAGDLADNVLALIQASKSPARQACADCNDLRGRLVNIYHLTLTGHDLAATVRAVRAASGPGAPAPLLSTLPEEWICVPCRERDVRTCDEDLCCQQCGNDLVQRDELLEFLAPPAPASPPQEPHA